MVTAVPGDPAERHVDAFFELATGFMATKYLFAASELGIFEALSATPLPADELARRLALDPSRLSVLLNALAALNVIEIDERGYRHSPMSAALLAGCGDIDMRPLVRFWSRMNYPLWGRLEAAVRTGRAFGSMHLAGEAQRVYSEGVEACSLAAATALPRCYDFSRHAHLLDVGGGTGIWTRMVLQSHRHLSATIFELPDVVPLALDHLARHGVTERSTCVAGDCFADPIPAGHDVVLVANVLHAFAAPRNEELLRRLRSRVQSGTTLLLADYWTDETKVVPRLATIIAGSFMLTTGEGAVYSTGEVRRWLRASHWRMVDHTPLSGAQSVIIAVADDI